MLWHLPILSLHHTTHHHNLLLLQIQVSCTLPCLRTLPQLNTTHYSNTAHYIHVGIENLSRYICNKMSLKAQKNLSQDIKGAIHYLWWVFFLLNISVLHYHYRCSPHCRRKTQHCLMPWSRYCGFLRIVLYVCVW